MSLWKYNDFEYDLDFTDADFMERYERNYKMLLEDRANIKKTGTQSEIIRSECKAYFKFFDNLFGHGTHEKMFGNKMSVILCLDAVEGMVKAYNDQESKILNMQKYIVRPQHQNRQQRRSYQKHGRR